MLSISHGSWGGWRPRRARLALVLAVVSALVGCGPIVYTANILGAQRAVSEAREAGASEHAPYEYYMADAYLQKAEEECNEGQYQDAIEYARSAEVNGVKARDLSRRHMQETGR